MNMTERVAYLKGLVNGLEIDATQKEGKVIYAILEVLDEMAATIVDLEEAYDEVEEVVDTLDEDLGQLEEDFYDLDGECDCDACDDDEHSCECDDCCGPDEDAFYEVVCPSCGNTICLSEDMLEAGGIDCPNCGENMEFDLEDEEETEGEAHE